MRRQLAIMFIHYIKELGHRIRYMCYLKKLGLRTDLQRKKVDTPSGSLAPLLVYTVQVQYCFSIVVHVLMRDEKEGREKQARSNKQGKATQHTQGSHFS